MIFLSVSIKRRQNKAGCCMRMKKNPTWTQRLLAMFIEKRYFQEAIESCFLFLFSLQLYTSVALWRRSWTSWNCFKARSRTQKTTPFSIWTCLQRVWWIADRGRTPTLTGSTLSRSLRYDEHRTHAHVQQASTAVHLLGSLLLMSLIVRFFVDLLNADCHRFTRFVIGGRK